MRLERRTISSDIIAFLFVFSENLNTNIKDFSPLGEGYLFIVDLLNVKSQAIVMRTCF